MAKYRPPVNFGDPLIPTGKRPRTSTPTSTGPNGAGFGTKPTGQTQFSDRGAFQGDWQSMIGFDASNLPTNYVDFLIALLSNRNIPSELQTLILQQLLQQGSNSEQRNYDWQLTQDQRQYDWNLLQDSRIYNSPTNELARLMGAGIGRDAAIQLLSGSGASAGVGAGGSPVVGSAAQVPMPDTFGNQTLNRISTAFQGIDLAMSLISQGVDVVSAISNAQLLQAQNYMSQQQLQAFQGVNDITSAFNQAVLDGTLTVEDVQGLRTADDYYKWITDHADTKLAKPLIENGSVSRVFGSSYGRSMMNHHLENTRLGRDSGRLFDAYVQQSELDADLKEVGLAQSKRDYYVSFNTTFNDILSSNIELAQLYQQYLTGEKHLEISGVQVDLAKYSRNAAKRQDFVQQVEFDAFSDALKQTTVVNQDGQQVTITGKDILSYDAFSKLLRSYYDNRAIVGQHGVDIPTEDGGKRIGTARERYQEFLNANLMVAITGAFLQDCIANNRLAGYNGNLAPIYRFADMWNNSGLGTMVTTGSNVAETWFK